MWRWEDLKRRHDRLNDRQQSVVSPQNCYEIKYTVHTKIYMLTRCRGHTNDLTALRLSRRIFPHLPLTILSTSCRWRTSSMRPNSWISLVLMGVRSRWVSLINARVICVALSSLSTNPRFRTSTPATNKASVTCTAVDIRCPLPSPDRSWTISA